MPSLRRSFSSPSVRPAPYLSSTRPPRRPSGSATAERRVLADIEWWRVYDGQCDQDSVQDDTDVPPGGTLTLSPAGASLEPLHGFDSVQYSSLASLHSRDSSVESTPELSTTPLSTLQLSLDSSPYGDHLLYPSSLTRPAGRQVHPLFGLRSISAPGFSYQASLEPDFADMGGLSFSLDQNLFQ